ncbi:MAG: T9SS C-terminal target domain-containing protein, partial [candidate division KSB1 bacterium]|nr:T9SS C-terminal target domain-containing protein [candidate division KSB1 bacterium]
TTARSFALKAADLDNVRVVPNPFVVTSLFDVDRDRHEIHFIRVPAQCTIKIFTLTGELVRTIEHDRSTSNGLDFAKWDLKNEFGSEVAYGVYLYHLQSSVGSKIGKIAVLR